MFEVSPSNRLATDRTGQTGNGPIAYRANCFTNGRTKSERVLENWKSVNSRRSYWKNKRPVSAAKCMQCKIALMSLRPNRHGLCDGCIKCDDNIVSDNADR